MGSVAMAYRTKDFKVTKHFVAGKRELATEEVIPVTFLNLIFTSQLMTEETVMICLRGREQFSPSCTSI